MKAIKDNKVYTISEASKGEYLARGFDIYDDRGELTERSPSATVPAAKYDELLAKYNALAAEKTAEQPKKKGKAGGEPDVSDT
ncbi:MAG: hypothetical protein IJ071_04430 [Ruminococcus sp.]|nr:hypothetical protein [Ruminococcus sp.]